MPSDSCNFTISSVILVAQSADLAEFILATDRIYEDGTIQYRLYDTNDAPLGDWTNYGQLSANNTENTVSVAINTDVCKIDFRIYGECPDCPSSGSSGPSVSASVGSSGSSASDSNISSGSGSGSGSGSASASGSGSGSGSASASGSGSASASGSGSDSGSDSVSTSGGEVIVEACEVRNGFDSKVRLSWSGFDLLNDFPEYTAWKVTRNGLPYNDGLRTGPTSTIYLQGYFDYPLFLNEAQTYCFYLVPSLGDDASQGIGGCGVTIQPYLASDPNYIPDNPVCGELSSGSSSSSSVPSDSSGSSSSTSTSEGLCDGIATNGMWLFYDNPAEDQYVLEYPFGSNLSITLGGIRIIDNNLSFSGRPDLTFSNITALELQEIVSYLGATLGDYWIPAWHQGYVSDPLTEGRTDFLSINPSNITDTSSKFQILWSYVEHWTWLRICAEFYGGVPQTFPLSMSLCDLAYPNENILFSHYFLDMDANCNLINIYSAPNTNANYPPITLVPYVDFPYPGDDPRTWTFLTCIADIEASSGSSQSISSSESDNCLGDEVIVQTPCDSASSGSSAPDPCIGDEVLVSTPCASGNLSICHNLGTRTDLGLQACPHVKQNSRYKLTNPSAELLPVTLRLDTFNNEINLTVSLPTGSVLLNSNSASGSTNKPPLCTVGTDYVDYDLLITANSYVWIDISSTFNNVVDSQYTENFSAQIIVESSAVCPTLQFLEDFQGCFEAFLHTCDPSGINPEDRYNNNQDYIKLLSTTTNQQAYEVIFDAFDWANSIQISSMGSSSQILYSNVNSTGSALADISCSQKYTDLADRVTIVKPALSNGLSINVHDYTTIPGDLSGFYLSLCPVTYGEDLTVYGWPNNFNSGPSGGVAVSGISSGNTMTNFTGDGTIGAIRIGDNNTEGWIVGETLEITSTAYPDMDGYYTITEIKDFIFPSTNENIVWGGSGRVTLAFITPDFDYEPPFSPGTLFDLQRTSNPTTGELTEQHWSNVVSEPWLGYLSQAVGRWSNLVKFSDDIVNTINSFPGYENWSGITLAQVNIYNDPSSNTVASCGPIWIYDIDGDTSPGINTMNFALEINEAYVSALTNDEWVDVMTHELGHALGIGLYWSNSYSQYGAGGFILDGTLLDGTYYSNALEAYNNIYQETGFGTEMTFAIATETTGGAGTAGGHWENECFLKTDMDSTDRPFFGFTDELMIGYVIAGGNSTISDLTLGALRDFGYETANTGERTPNLSSCQANTQSATAYKHKLDCGCGHRTELKPINPKKTV